MGFETPKASTGYTPEEKAEALKQARKEEGTRQEVTFDQQMDNLVFSRYRKDWAEDGKLDKADKKYIDIMETEYRNGNLEIPLAQIQFEISGLKGDIELKSQDHDPKTGYLKPESVEEIIKLQNRLKELSLLERGLLEKEDFSAGKELDLGELLYNKRKEFMERAKSIQGESYSKEKFIQYNKLLEVLPDEFTPKMWQEVLKDIEVDLSIAEGERDYFLTSFVKGEIEIEEARHELGTRLRQQAELKRYKEMIEEKVYGPGPKSEEEKQRIEDLRKKLEADTGKESEPDIEKARKTLGEEKVREVDIPRPEFLKGRDFEERFSDIKFQDISEKDIKDFRNHVLRAIDSLKMALIKHRLEGGKPEHRIVGNIVNIASGEGVRFAEKIIAKKERRVLPGQISAMDIRQFLKEYCDYELKDKDWDNYFS